MVTVSAIDKNSRVEFSPDRPAWLREGFLRSVIPVIAALAAFVAACVIAYLIHLKHLDARAHPLLSAGERIQKQLEIHETILGAVKGLFLAEGSMISRQKFASFLASMPATAGINSLQG